mmetsp:Transcript_116383/g.290639  ORF Transcript_116383/g.290639 Transcript_116383/m.290639 type:complete len:243 (-) Transcript_116383:217-945(-)
MGNNNNDVLARHIPGHVVPAIQPLVVPHEAVTLDPEHDRPRVLWAGVLRRVDSKVQAIVDTPGAAMRHGVPIGPPIDRLSHRWSPCFRLPRATKPLNWPAIGDLPIRSDIDDLQVQTTIVLEQIARAVTVAGERVPPPQDRPHEPLHFTALRLHWFIFGLPAALPLRRFALQLGTRTASQSSGHPREQRTSQHASLPLSEGIECGTIDTPLLPLVPELAHRTATSGLSAFQGAVHAAVALAS